MRMPRIAMEPAVIVVACVRNMSSESNLGPALPAVKPHDTVRPPMAAALLMAALDIAIDNIASVAIVGLMIERGPSVDPLLPLPAATFHILMALADGDRHGYGIIQDVAASTDGA